MVNNGRSTCVVHCHPDPSAFSEKVLEAVTVGLSGEQRVRVCRLYHDDEPSQDDLLGAKHLVLVYPTWWGGLPGRMLEWFQTSFSPWIDDEAPMETSPLRGVSLLSAVVTHGSSSFVNHLQGEPGRHLLSRTATKLCSDDVVFGWVPLYRSDKSENKTRQEFLAKVTSHMSGREGAT